MAIFPNIKNENIVQVNDKTRIDCTDSFISKQEATITLVEIQPSADDDFIDVTGTSSSDWYLDWQYATENTDGETITCRITTDGTPATSTSTIYVYSADTDKLLSTDQDLVRHEPDILKWLPQGKNSFKYMHRLAQDLILQWMDRNGFVDINGDKYTKSAMLDISEFTEWSKFLVLKLIFQGISNSVDDIFQKKSHEYESKEITARQRIVLRIDVSGDGTLDDFEYAISTGRIYRS